VKNVFNKLFNQKDLDQKIEFFYQYVKFEFNIFLRSTSRIKKMSSGGFRKTEHGGKCAFK